MQTGGGGVDVDRNTVGGVGRESSGCWTTLILSGNKTNKPIPLFVHEHVTIPRLDVVILFFIFIFIFLGLGHGDEKKKTDRDPDLSVNRKGRQKRLIILTSSSENQVFVGY